MKAKSLLLYFLGIGLLLFGNRELWDKIQLDREEEKQRQTLADEAEKVKSETFKIEKIQFDSISKTWKNPEFYFQVINAGSPNFKALRKGVTKTETTTSEDASASQ